MIKDEDSIPTPTNVDLIKQMIKDYDIDVTEVPRLLFADCLRLLIDERGPVLTIDTDKLSLFEDQAISMTPTQKLKFDGYGDWEFNATMVHSAYFATREEVDDFLVPEFTIDPNNTRKEWRDKISIEEIGTMGGMKYFSLNLDYYLSNWEELEKDLDRPVDKNLDRTETEWKQLSDELFYKQMCRIFGGPLAIDDEQDEDVKKFMITDFNITVDGGYFHASGRRGQFYILFLIVV